MKVDYEIFSTIGRVRKANQDNYYVDGYTKPIQDNESQMSGSSESDIHRVAVCDGMGGMSSGEIASQIAVQILINHCSKKTEFDWEDYIEEVNIEICKYQSKHHIHMGTTLAGLSVNSSEVISVNIGDSRVYQIRRGKIRQLSKDHNEYQIMVNSGIQFDESIMRMAKCHLTQFLGLEREKFNLEPHIVVEKCIPGDIYILCSDGLYNVLSDEQMLNIICKESKARYICKKLVKKAEEEGSMDNITAMLVYIEKCKKYNQYIEKFKIIIREIIFYLRKNHMK